MLHPLQRTTLSYLLPYLFFTEDYERELIFAVFFLLIFSYSASFIFISLLRALDRFALQSSYIDGCVFCERKHILQIFFCNWLTFCC